MDFVISPEYLMPPSAMIGIPSLGNLVAVHDSGHLRHADTCYHTGGTDGTRSDTDLHRIYASLDQGTGSLCGSHVSCDHLQFG